MSRQFPALRGLAIALVVLHHSVVMATTYPPSLGYPPVSGIVYWLFLLLQELGVFAVPAFLFISGSFVAYAARGTAARFTWKAVWRTISRILWPYLLWSLVYYVVLYVVRGDRKALLGVVKDLLVGYPYHFVPLLVFYYLISPVLTDLARRWGLAVLVVAWLFQLSLLNLIHPGALGFAFPEWVRAVVPRYYNQAFADWAVYFPLGLVCGLNARAVVPWVRKLRWLLLAATGGFFVLHILSAASIAHFPLAGYLAPVAFVLFSLVLGRKATPAVRRFEQVGKRSYGLYLIHLSVIWLVAAVAGVVAPWPLGSYLVLAPTLLVLSMGTPLLLMKAAASWLPGRVYRVIFG